MQKQELHDILYRQQLSMSDKNKLYNFIKKFVDLFKGDKIDDKYLPNINQDIDLNDNKIKSNGNEVIKNGTGQRSLIVNDCSYNKAEGNLSYVEGSSCKANGYASHAEGSDTKALGNTSHAEGHITTANGNNSHAEGSETISFGETSHAEGFKTNAKETYSHAEGFGSIANAYTSHAEGYYTTTIGSCSHAEGKLTTTLGDYSHAEGICNVKDSNAIHQIGIGIANSNDTVSEYKDAHRITQDGKHYILNIGGFDGTKATANLTTEKDLASVISDLITRVAALEAKQTTT